jgi:hypothetical protein
MGEIIKLFSTRLESMCNEYKKKIYLMPSWQLDNILPNEIKEMAIDEKADYLLEKYRNNNPFYLLLITDLNLIKQKNEETTFAELKSLNIDPRYLESMGLKENQIEDYYEFVTKAKAMILK